MQIFEYPYVIITVLVAGFLIMGAIGIYFSVKCVRVANETEEKGFVGINRIENDYDKSRRNKKSRCLIFISVDLDSMIRLYSESKAKRVFLDIRRLFLMKFSEHPQSKIASAGTYNFLVLTDDGAQEIIDDIEVSLSQINKKLIDNRGVNAIKVRFGIYSTNSTEVTFNTALTRAKQACAMAEETDEHYCEWDSQNGRKFEKKVKIENNIETEIDNNRFFLVYQPIIDAKTGLPMGAEVLARLNSKDEGVLNPGAFLDAVNNVGLTEKFDYYIFEKNCKWISNDKEKREKYMYTINFSRETLCDEKFPEKLIGIIDKYGIKYSATAIEILEDKNLSDKEKDILKKNISVLKEKGIVILLDDFGSGFTSFTDLNDFNVNIVKIDRKVIQNALEKTGYLIFMNILRTARELGFKTLCEGIETEEMKNLLTESGCDYLQGFYYYKPMPVAQFEKLFEKIEGM